MILVMAVLVILAVMKGNCLPVNSNQTSSDLCSSSRSFYPDPENCRKFYRCVNRKFVSMSCPPNTAFDASTQTCDWSQDVTGCSNGNSHASAVKPSLFDVTQNKHTATIEKVHEAQDNTKWSKAKIEFGGDSFTTISIVNTIQNVSPEIVKEKSGKLNNKSNQDFVKTSNKADFSLNQVEPHHVIKLKLLPLTLKPLVTSSTNTPATAGLDKWYHKMNEPAQAVKNSVTSSAHSPHSSFPASYNSHTDEPDFDVMVSTEANTSNENKTSISVSLQDYKALDNKLTALSSDFTSQQMDPTETSLSNDLPSAGNHNMTAAIVNIDEINEEIVDNDKNINDVIERINNTATYSSTISANGTTLRNENLFGNIQINTQPSTNVILTTSMTRLENATESSKSTENIDNTLKISPSYYPDQESNINSTELKEGNSSGREQSGNKRVPFEDPEQLIEPYSARIDWKFYKMIADGAKDNLQAQLSNIKADNNNKKQIRIQSGAQIPATVIEHVAGRIVNRELLKPKRSEKAKPRWYDSEVSSSKLTSSRVPKTKPEETSQFSENLKSELNSRKTDKHIENLQFEKIQTEFPLPYLRDPGTTASGQDDGISPVSRDEHTTNHTNHNSKTHIIRSPARDLTNTGLEGIARHEYFIGAFPTELTRDTDRSQSVNFMSAPYLVTGLVQQFQCPRLDGHFSDPKNCGVYYHCSRGHAYRRDCPSGQVFHSGVQSCVSSNVAPPCPSAYSGNSQEDGFSKRSLCKSPNGLFKDEVSCNYYFECIDGIPTRRRCLVGTLFDDVLGKCSWSKFVPSCEQETNSRPKGDIFGLERSRFQCPRDGYFRDPKSCDVYYLCVDGKAQQKTCDPLTSFDMTLNMCVWSDLVDGCKNGNDVETDEVLKSNSLVGDYQKHETRTGAIKQLPDQQDTDYKCPEDDGVFPDNTDCSVYYRCANGVGSLLKCRGDLGYDVENDLCTDKTQVSRCMAGQLSDTRISKPDLIIAPSFNCPEAHGLYSDPNHCSFFIHCFKTIAYRHQCQPGTVFSTKHAACTWPQLVGECQDTDNSKAPDIQEHNVTTLRQSKEEPKAIQAETYQHHMSFSETARYKVQPAGLQEFKCPSVEDGFYRDSTFCDIFHRCFFGNKFTFTCPTGTFFRPEDNLCDFWDTVKDCTQDGIRVAAMGRLPKVVPSSGSLQVPQSYPDQFDDISIVSIDGDHIQCPAANGLFPHPSKCYQFLFCTKFTPLVLTCPESLLYNPQSLTCDFPKKVKCFQYDNYNK